MNTTESYIESKKKKKHVYHLINSLKDYYASEEKRDIQDKELSKDNAHLGLLLLNKVKTQADENDTSYWYRPNVEQNSKRFKELSEIASPKGFWDDERFELLVFLFGGRLAPIIKTAWDLIPSLMYQSGYYRRSFRGSGLEGIYFTRQLNFIIDAIYESEYDMPLEDYVLYANNISYNNTYSLIYAAAIELGDESFKQLCLDIVYCKHETAKPSRDVIKALLLTHSKECWVAVEKLLLSAQRQEGLRQTILECLDETSLGAMKHMIKVILSHKLTRFSSVVRAIDTWAGFGWESERETTVRRFLELADLYLNTPSEIKKAISSNDNAEVYMALWAQGVIDVAGCIPFIDTITEGNDEKITLALFFISHVNLSTFSIKYGKKFIEHSDSVIKCLAAALLDNSVFIKVLSTEEKSNLFKKLELQIPSLPIKYKTSKPRVFSWLTLSYGKEPFQELMISLLDLKNEQDVDKILPYFEELPVHLRERVTNSVLSNYSGYNFDKSIKRDPLTQKERDFAFKILKDRAEGVKEVALRALSQATLTPLEVEVFEGLLTRKSADFRKSVINLITKHGVEQLKASTSRLLQAKNQEQRLAGLDLLLRIKNTHEEEIEWLNAKVKEFKARKVISSKEEVVLTGLDTQFEDGILYSEENGFGLYNPDNIPKEEELDRTQTGTLLEARIENDFGLSISADKVNQAIKDLGELFLAHKDFEYTHEDWNNTQVTSLLGNEFCSIKRNTETMTEEEVFCNYPLPEVWRKWYNDSKLTPRDLFLINLHLRAYRSRYYYKKLGGFNDRIKEDVFIPTIPKLKKHEWSNPIYTILSNLEDRYPYDTIIDYLSDWLKETFNKLEPNEIGDFKEIKSDWNTEFKTWRDHYYVSNVWSIYTSTIKEMNPGQFKTYWNLHHWYFLTAPTTKNIKQEYIPSLYAYARAYQDGLINLDLLYWRAFKEDAINALTKKVISNRYDIKKEFTFLNEIVDNCRNRVLDIELIRGDSSTAVTHLAQNINRLFGISNFIQLLKALGTDTLHRGYIYNYGGHEYNKKEILSTLLKRCFPSKDSSQEEFNKAVKQEKITDKRLCEAATYSPQWLPFVSKYLEWKDMESAVWWLHAHTNGRHDSQTESEIAKYSSVDVTAFNDGAVDINWFKETYKSLGKKRWSILYDAAKYISDGGGHKRGLLYADVILGNTKIKEVTERIKSKRNQEFVRVYGVIPLSKTNPKKDVLRRYQFLQKFKKESKQFGSQRQASEAIAIKIALENLARTAGYPDPIRLQWAMETKEAQDIMANSTDLTIENTSIKLEIDGSGKSSINAYKEGKKLKSIPTKLRKHKEYLKLKDFNKTLREQFRRTRKSLENAMVNGDVFSKEEIETLMSHPVVAPMLKKLVLKSNGNLGFWSEEMLVSPNGERNTIGEEILIAHCVDLYEDKKWSDYQRYCFEFKLIQPFKQVFRELYVPTNDELKEQSISRRYAGHQVQPKKTVALLKGQNWTVDYEEGLQKVNHKQNIISKMFALADWFTPADVEAPTLETVEFFDRKKWERIPFEKVDKRVFSETMRDIDLVVSVAHVGDVDPEASHSTIELRSVIIEETCRLFKIENVTLSDNHAKISGSLGEYSVHLGSGISHKVAGSSLSIIPVHSQHRGRMFLPFMDEDPKTAEIMSKVLLLAKDSEMNDPTILRQL